MMEFKVAPGCIWKRRRWILDELLSKQPGREVLERYQEVWKGFEDYQMDDAHLRSRSYQGHAPNVLLQQRLW
jgi:hypothetical protein